ncbi:MAG: amino acid adenylation domain-containing protein, partial [Tatlockia sp.]|nr:amino acid adenylation domain-containing protein [Tatlockia sp.]
PTTLYNINFIRANFALAGLDLSGIDVKPIPVFTGAVKDDLCLLYDETDAFEFEIEYRKNKYSSRYISEIEASFCRCLRGIIKDPLTKIANLDVFQHSVSVAKVSEKPSSPTLINRFIHHATTTPQKLALVTSKAKLSYRDLYEQVLFLVNYFHNVVSLDNPVIVILKREPSLLTTLLALQWLGIPYIPVDRNTPSERVSLIMHESGASTLIVDDLTNYSSLERLTLPVHYDKPAQKIAPRQGEIAYIIYTSGSTGTPKGVSVGSKALDNFLECMSEHFARQDNSLLLAITTIAFDISGLELLLPIFTGTVLYLSNDAQFKDPFAIAAILHEHPISCLQATPAMWSMLLDTGWVGEKNLVALCGGEALTPPLATRLLNQVSELWNMYGPTEATIWCALKKIKAEEPISIGKPINNLELFILDDQLNVLPPCVKGELYIAGIGLAEGYWKQPDLTAKQFFIHPSLHRRLYRTGDIACMNYSGEYLVFGRKDNQIKLHGYRIELGEIEAQIAAIKGVRETVVIVHNEQLIAYVVGDALLTEDLLEKHIMLHLPDYMRPKRNQFMEHLPLSNSGKIDRKALPRDLISTPARLEPPATMLEEKLLALWLSALNQQSLSVTANFYQCGGHSLLATQIIAQLYDEYNIRLQLNEFMSYPTIRTSAAYLESAGEKTVKIPKSVLIHYPLTEAQNRFWFLSQLSQDIGQFNMAVCIHIPVKLKPHQLEETFFLLLNQHSLLRAHISLEDGVPRQRPLSSLDLPLTYYQNTAKGFDIHTYFTNWAHQPFNRIDSSLWRACVVQINKDQFFLGLCFHHLICDGYSASLLLQDFFTIFQEQSLALPADISYFDYAAWQNTRDNSASKIHFWKQQLADCPYLNLPTDYDRQETYSYSGKLYAWELANQSWEEIRSFCQSAMVSTSSYCIAVFALFLQRVTKQDDFCIGIPVMNRDQAELTNLVGCFFNVLPLRITIPSKESFRQWIGHIHGLVQHVVSAKNISFSKLLEHLAIPRQFNQSPLFNAVINIQPDFFKTKNSANWVFEPIHTQTSKYDLSMDLYFTENSLRGTCEYATHLFEASRMEQWCNLYQLMLTEYLQIDKWVEGVNSHNAPTIMDLNPQVQHDRVNESPISPLQQKIALQWEKHLAQKKIMLQDNYFSLGGHSLLGTQLIAALSKELSLSIPLETLFRYPVFEQFCTAISALQAVEKTGKPITDIVVSKLSLTPNQQQLALLYQKDKSDAYHLGVLCECPKEMTFSLLQKAICSALDEHLIYRWKLDVNKSKALVSEKSLPEILRVNTLNREETLIAAKRVSVRTFNLQQAPLVRFLMIKEDNKTLYLFISMHHLIGDEWSLELLIQAIFHSRPNSAKSQWPHFHESCINEQTQSLEYWQKYLVNAHTTTIPYTKNQAKIEGKANRLIRRLSQPVVNQCQKLSERSGVSRYLVMFAAYLLFIKHFTNDNPVYVATAYDRRNTVELQSLHGYLVNLLPVQIDFSQVSSLKELLNLLDKDRIQNMQHGSLDFAQLIEKGIAPKPALIFNYQHAYQMTTGQQEALSWEEIFPEHTKFPFTLQLRAVAEDQMECTIEYAADCYDEAFIQLALDAYESILTLLPSYSNQLLHALHLTEKPLIIGSRYRPNILQGDSFLSVLRNQTKEHKDKIAIHYANQSLSYEQLWAKVNKVASALWMTYGNSLDNQIIAVALPNSELYVISILAILTVGAAFLPIDLSYPLYRQELLIEESGCCLIIAEESFVHTKAVTLTSLLNIETTVQFNNSNPLNNAYVIYTSGTTGLPKSVVISQIQLHRFIDALNNTLKLTAVDKVLQFASISFDASIWEIFISLYCGATLFIPTKKSRNVGTNLQKFIQNNEITHALLTPSVLQTLDPKELSTLRTLASGGEACTSALVERWANKVEFFNAYGPTEATICTNLARLKDLSKPSIIGQALGDTYLQILSDNFQQLPAGAIGELWISGANLTAGYLNQPQFNEDRFTLLSGTRWYKTGDYARLLADNQFEYFGRKDRQVKLRGLRIELSEVETALQSSQDIEQAVCHVYEDRLIAYVVSTKQLELLKLRTELSKQLPLFLLPNQIIQIESLPLLPSGKVNLVALPIPSETIETLVSPQNEEESVIYKIWKTYLPIQNFSISHDFFSLGGNSLQAMQIIAEIEQHFSIDLSMENFYNNPTIKQQGTLVGQRCVSEKESLVDLISQLSLDEQMELLNLSESDLS